MAYKVFQNGYPLPASELNNYLMNQTVMVFATASARAADIPSPTEGMVTYREDANVLEVYNGSAWTDINDNTAAIPKSLIDAAGDLIVGTAADTPGRLAVGSAGSILKSDGSAPVYLAPGTSGYVLGSTGSDIAWIPQGTSGIAVISTTTLSGSSVTVSSIPSTYTNIWVVVEGITSASDQQPRVRFNGDSGTNYLAVQSPSTGSTVAKQNYLAVYQSTADLTPATPNALSFVLENYSTSNALKIGRSMSLGEDSSASADYRVSNQIVGYFSSSAVSSLEFYTTSGTFTGGTLTLYGVK